MIRHRLLRMILGLAALLAAGGAVAAPLGAVAELGRRMFFDPSLSASGAMSCASCHDPAHHYGPPNDLVVQLGGLTLDQPGQRVAPPLTYRGWTPAFSIGIEAPGSSDDDAPPAVEVAAVAGGRAADPPPAVLAATHSDNPADGPNLLVPVGGMFWDGRADTLQEQALGPLLNPVEMANRDAATLAARFRAAYGRDLAALFGAGILADDKAVLAESGFALARFQIEDASFHPFSAKFDAVTRGEAKFTPAEARGKALFDDAKKGNCAACHLDTPQAADVPALFTDYQYEALAPPRNPAIAANADPRHYDLGLCGPARDDVYARQAANCGLFKTPSLRNVAERHVLFHNGVYHTLEDAVRFYVERDVAPEKIYPRRPDGTVDAFNDLPAAYRGNIDVVDAPFGRRADGRPALDDGEIADLVAFLKTLTDGWTP